MKVVIDSGEWAAGHNIYLKKIDISGQTKNYKKNLVHIKSSLQCLISRKIYITDCFQTIRFISSLLFKRYMLPFFIYSIISA